jgi:hypothetical protein
MVVRSITLWPVCPQEGFLPIFHGRLQLGDFPVINDDQCHSMSTFSGFSHTESHTEVDPLYVDDIPLVCLSFCWGAWDMCGSARQVFMRKNEPCGRVL